MKLKTKFQDEDFELGEVVNANIFYSGDTRQGFKVVAVAKAGGECSFYYDSLEKLYNDWEDYEEPKGIVEVVDRIVPTMVYIEYSTEEEAEEAVEKLKAWQRLKDKGLKFKSWGWEDPSDNEYTIYFTLDSKSGDAADLDLLFGGEE